MKQRLGRINKKIVGRDEVLVELLQVPGARRSTRWFHNRQRHVDRINRELAAAGFSSLPQELLYRTYTEWGASGEIFGIGKGLLAGGPLSEQGLGLACLQPVHVDLGPVEPCELIGRKALYHPVDAFFRQHKAEQLVALERDIAEGRARRSTWSPSEIIGLLAERFVLQPLVLTSGWSEMSKRINWEGRTEYEISATYKGEPTLWQVGPGIKMAKNPLCIILDKEVVTLRVRLPLTGKADPQADLRSAATKLEALLDHVSAKVGAFNATRHAAAERRLRYDLSHKRPGRFAETGIAPIGDAVVRGTGKGPSALSGTRTASKRLAAADVPGVGQPPLPPLAGIDGKVAWHQTLHWLPRGQPLLQGPGSDAPRGV